MRRTTLALVLAVAACGGGSNTAADAPGPDAPPGTADAALVTCEGKTALPLDDVWTVPWNNVDRSVHVHVPASYDPAQPTPVVLGFHGYTLSADIQASQSKMIEKSDAEAFIAVHADGTGALKGWNAGDCCGTAAASGVDDVGLVGAILDELETRACVDADRIYATGFSNGGFLSHRLGCELSDRIAAIAPVSGVMGIDDCNPGRPVPVFEVHGDIDGVVPYNGGGIGGFRSVADTIAGWVERDGCPPGAPAETYQNGDATCLTNAGCTAGAEVTLCTIAGGGHQWPGGTDLPGGGHTSTDLDATAAIWDFFVAHPMVR
jgi:polyhydroxybutyrate depolymerase